MASTLIRDTDERGEGGHVKMETEVGVMQPPEAGRGSKQNLS